MIALVIADYNGEYIPRFAWDEKNPVIKNEDVIYYE